MPAGPISPRVLTPSQAAVEALHGASSPPSSSSPKARGPRNASVPLQRLECVRVAKRLRRNGHRLYVVSVFYKRTEARRRLSDCVYKASVSSKLPPEDMHALIISEREPDYVVEHRFSEFRQLRDCVAALVRANCAHGLECTGCQNLQLVITSPQHHNWTVKRMFGNKEQRFELLTTFVNDLLALVSERSTSGGSLEESGGAGSAGCSVQERVLELLQKFLKRSYQPSLGII